MCDTPKVSVIVPMYNPGSIIQRGLNSLLRQTLKDIEIILVDDGSMEETLAEARIAAANDTRIRILKTEVNSGAGIARNLGIKNAGGKYIAFMDADDYISCDYLELLYRKAEIYQADISKGSLIHVSENGKRKKTQPSSDQNSTIRKGLKNGKQLYTLFLYNHYSAIYKRQWLRQHNIQYGTSRYGEDSTFLLRATANTERIVFDDRANYYLVDQPNSLMKRMSENRLDEQLLALREQVNYLIDRFDDHIDLQYEMLRIRWALGVQAAAVRQGNMDQKASTFLKGIQTEAMRLPNLPQLAIYSPMIGALIEYRENLCSMIMRDIECDYEEDALIDSVIRCFRFASQHPDRGDLFENPLQECIARLCAYLLGKSSFKGKDVPASKKVLFIKKLYSELRGKVDMPFLKEYLKKQMSIKKIIRLRKTISLYR